MEAFYLHGARDLRLQEIDIPSLKADEVLVRIRATGICGSDLHYYEYFRNGDFIPKQPFVLGHESAGEIADPGAFAERLPVGSRVAIDPSHPCRNCSYCVGGRYNLCTRMRYFGSAAYDPPVDGAFREYVPARAENCHLIPEDMKFREAALLEPLSIALHGVAQAGNIAGKRVLICGAGPIGQLLGLVTRHYGAARLMVTDLRPGVLKVAERWADVGVPADDPSQLDAAFDVVIEASGAAAALTTAYERCGPGGTIVQLGIQTKPSLLPVNLVMQKELTVKGSFRFARMFAKAVDLLGRRKLDVTPLLSHGSDFFDLVRGFEAALAPDTLKVVVDYP